MTNYYKEQGLSGAELDNAVSSGMRARKSGAIGEIGALLAVSTMSERYAQKEFTTILGKKPIQAATKKELSRAITIPSIKILGRAGFAEGFSQSLAQNTARAQPLDLKQAGLYGAFGAVSAAAIGTPIIKMQLTKPAGSKILQGVSYVTDPYEYAGDKIAEGTFKMQEVLTGKAVAKPVLKVSGKAARAKVNTFAFTTTANVFTNTKTQTPSNTQTKSGKQKGGVFANVFTKLGIMTPTPTPLETEKATPKGIIPSPNIPDITIPSIDIPTPVPTPTNTDTSVPVPIPTNIFTNTQTSTSTSTNTQTPTNINTFINTPVITPQIRIPPPVPLAFDLGQGFGAGYRKGKKSLYVDELSAGVALFSGLTGKTDIFKVKAKDYVKRAKTKKKRR